MHVNLKISENIKKVRKTNNLSQEKFAEQINISARTVCNIENRLVIPRVQTLINIGEKFNCSIDSLLK